MKKYLLFEEQIKILLKDAYIEGINIGRNIIPKETEIDFYFEEWYKDFVNIKGEKE